MDFRKSFHGKRIFGPHKTWRGLISGSLAGLLVFALQQSSGTGIASLNHRLTELGYFHAPLVLGLLLGFGALAGDAMKSFFKRQQRIDAGQTWFPLDQLDYIIGACLLSLLVIVLPLELYLCIFIVWFGMHLLFSYIGYKLGFKDAPM
jgi:CDP-2,3-bis-(O-geranylgeranyl)-sn-glycerol synthase